MENTLVVAQSEGAGGGGEGGCGQEWDVLGEREMGVAIKGQQEPFQGDGDALCLDCFKSIYWL